LYSIILIRENQLYLRSTAALEIARRLDFPWPVLYAFIIIPRFLRDGIYDWISARRYRFFGKKDSCWIPTPALKERFLE
jgi:predicted DCC family thiol-disulfide oxidoreductase YuxK